MGVAGGTMHTIICCKKINDYSYCMYLIFRLYIEFNFNPLTEACLGDSLIFECSTTAGSISGATVFQGDLLDYNDSSYEIVLLHNRFSNMSAATSETCNSGRVCGYSLPINGSEPYYTSQLRVVVSPDMIGKNIVCAYDDGATVNEIGNFSIEQCHAATVITIAPLTSKCAIHMGKSHWFYLITPESIWTETTVYENNSTTMYMYNKGTTDMHDKGTYIYILQHNSI